MAVLHMYPALMNPSLLTISIYSALNYERGYTCAADAEEHNSGGSFFACVDETSSKKMRVES